MKKKKFRERSPWTSHVYGSVTPLIHMMKTMNDINCDLFFDIKSLRVSKIHIIIICFFHCSVK